jgi:hypothetical protein
MITPPDKLMIIDYCGTLSLEAPRFGRPENLVRVLAESGLAAVGVSTPEAFWGTIVDPTWVKGSTTSIGFAQVMAEQIASLCLAPDAPTSEIEAATARFVATYLASSRIDPRWRSLLLRLNENPAVMTVVATDHYAEATGKITDYLDSWGISARKTGKAEEPPLPSLSKFFVANSADLGVWKADRSFWEILKSELPLASVQRILLIDDFGFNEAPGDSYGERAKVLARREKTVANLGKTFQAAVEVVPFDLPRDDWGCEEAGARLIEETASRVDAFLERR